MKRPVDTIEAEAVGVGSLDRFTSAFIVNDLSSPSEAGFEIGDDGTFEEIEEFVAPGTQYKVFVNSRLRLTGRIEVVDVPVDLQGAVVRFTVRTKLADAMYASADPRTKITGTSIKQFLLDLFAPLGYVDADFVFEADVSRNLMTGISKTTPKPAADLEPMKEDQARVNPPETIYAAAMRHLSRFGLMLWDTGDGRIVVGAPDDEQDPLYHLAALRGKAGLYNNLLSATRTKDWSELAASIGVFGVGRGASSAFAQAPLISVIEDGDMIDAGFYRPVLVLQEAIRNLATADRQAARELTNRSMRKDSWDFQLDGLSYWNGAEAIQWGIDTVADVDVDAAGGPLGPYLITRVELRRDANTGDATRLSAVRRGIYRL